MIRLFILILLLPCLSQALPLNLSELSKDIQDNITSRFPGIKSNPNPSELDQIIKYLIAQEQYDYAMVQVEKTKDGDQYKVVVDRAKRIVEIKFVGGYSYPENQIRKEFNLTEKTPFDQQLLIDGAERIRQFYISEGYPNASIDLEIKNKSKTDLAVNVIIKEAKQTKIKKIKVITPNTYLKETLYRKIDNFEDEAFTDKTLAELDKKAREFLSKEGYYKSELSKPILDLNKDESEVTLTYKIEKADHFDIDLDGNNTVWDRTILNSLELKTYFSNTPNLGPEIAARIKSLYLTKGYARVEVQGDESKTDRPFNKIITIRITEGPRVKIDSIEVSGRLSEKTDYYVDFIENNSSDLIDKGYYNREDLDSGLKNLRINRQNQGFLTAKVISTRTQYNKDRDEISIFVNFDEGPMTIVEKISFEGNKSYTPLELRKIVNLIPGQPLRLNELEDSIAAIKQYYKSQGFLEMQLSNEKEDLVTYNEDNTLAGLKFKIYEGPQITVGSILIEGNSITKDFVIIKELEFDIGTILTPEKLEESVSRLQRLGIFSSVDIRTLEEKTQIAKRTVIVRAYDRDPGLRNIGIGFTNERGVTVRGYAGIAYRNIGGSARAASLRFDGNYNISDLKYLERKVAVGYLEPYLFNSRLKGRVSLSQTRQIEDEVAKRASDTNQYIWSVEQDLTSNIFFSYEIYNLSRIQKFSIPGAPVDVPIETLDIATTGPTVDFDYRDHPFNPTKGTFTRLSAEYGSPQLGSNSTIEFVRSTASFTHYKPLKKTLVWANSVRGGYLKNLSKASDGGVPWAEKGLTLGGQSSLRGYLPPEAFPSGQDFEAVRRQYATDEEKNNLGVISPSKDLYLLKTDASMVLFKSEIRFPIWGNVGGAFFYDGGAVFIKNMGFDDPYRDAIGFGVRYATPVGAVSFELGWKLDYNEGRGESQLPFHFSIGTF